MKQLNNTSITNRTQKIIKPGQFWFRKCLDFVEPQVGHLEHNESVVGKEIGGQDLLPATPELHCSEIGDQHLCSKTLS